MATQKLSTQQTILKNLRHRVKVQEETMHNQRKDFNSQTLALETEIQILQATLADTREASDANIASLQATLADERAILATLNDKAQLIAQRSVNQDTIIDDLRVILNNLTDEDKRHQQEHWELVEKLGAAQTKALNLHSVTKILVDLVHVDIVNG